MHECVTFINNYLHDPNVRLSKSQIATAHWCVMLNCTEAEWYMETHRRQFAEIAPHGTDDDRVVS